MMMIALILEKLDNYGIEAIVIGLLVLLIFFIIKLFITLFKDTVTKMLKSFTESNENLRKEQVDERREWMTSQEIRDAKISASLDQIAAAFREQRMEQKYSRPVGVTQVQENEPKIIRSF